MAPLASERVNQRRQREFGLATQQRADALAEAAGVAPESEVQSSETKPRKGNRNAAYWDRPDVKKALACIDIWASQVWQSECILVPMYRPAKSHEGGGDSGYGSVLTGEHYIVAPDERPLSRDACLGLERVIETQAGQYAPIDTPSTVRPFSQDGVHPMLEMKMLVDGLRPLWAKEQAEAEIPPVALPSRFLAAVPGLILAFPPAMAKREQLVADRAKEKAALLAGLLLWIHPREGRYSRDKSYDTFRPRSWEQAERMNFKGSWRSRHFGKYLDQKLKALHRSFIDFVRDAVVKTSALPISTTDRDLRSSGLPALDAITYAQLQRLFQEQEREYKRYLDISPDHRARHREKLYRAGIMS